MPSAYFAAERAAAERITAEGMKEILYTIASDEYAGRDTPSPGQDKVAQYIVDRLKKLKVKPEPSATSANLKKGGDDNIAKLKTLKGAEFDKAYVANEVAYHQAVLDAVDKTLIPSAKNEELKALLVKVRPAFVAHLDHAKHLQSQLGK